VTHDGRADAPRSAGHQHDRALDPHRPTVAAADPDRRSVRPLAAADAFFVYAESRRVPQTVAAACHSDATTTRDGLVAHIAGLLDSAEWMRRMLVRRGGGWRRPAWRTVPASEVHLDRHVIEVAAPSPGGSAGLAAFAAAVAGLRLAEDRPPWRIWVLPDLGPGRTAFVIAAHHALCDGPGLIELLGTIFVPQVRLPTVQPAAGRPAGGGRDRPDGRRRGGVHRSGE
jgi:hypothetical protein